MHIYMKNVHCSGGELTLLDCSYKRNLSTNDHSKDLGIKCKKGKLILCAISANHAPYDIYNIMHVLMYRSKP